MVRVWCFQCLVAKNKYIKNNNHLKHSVNSPVNSLQQCQSTSLFPPWDTSLEKLLSTPQLTKERAAEGVIIFGGTSFNSPTYIGESN